MNACSFKLFSSAVHPVEKVETRTDKTSSIMHPYALAAFPDSSKY